jgi:hypothetical protein
MLLTYVRIYLKKFACRKPEKNIIIMNDRRQQTNEKLNFADENVFLFFLIYFA